MIRLAALLALGLGPAPSGLDGTWSGFLELDGRRLELVGWLQEEDGALRARLSVPALGAMNLEFAEELLPDGRTCLASPLPGDSLRLCGELETDERWSGAWSWSGGGGDCALERTAEERPYREVEVGFAAPGGPELAGTVLLPSGPGPFPAVVWAHGSGEIGRRSSDYVREPYGLVLHGVAALVYDKRGVGASAGDFRTATFHDLARDAAAGRAALAAFPEIDPARVGVGGISQAASWIAPLASELGGDFAFALALSATAVDAAEQHLYVVERRLRNAGFDDDAVGEALALHRRLDGRQRRLAGGEEPDPDADLARDLAAAASRPWRETALLPAELPPPYSETVRAWMWLDPLDAWRRFEGPVFLAWGSRDDVTNPERGPRLLGAALGARAEVHLYPGADHVLRLAGVPEPRPVAPGLLADLLRFLAAHAGPL